MIAGTLPCLRLANRGTMPAHRTKRADGRYSVTIRRKNPDGTTRTRGHRTDSDRAGAEHGSVSCGGSVD